MKKVLLASTALILTAGYAAAEGHSSIELSGSAIAGLTYNSVNTAAQGEINPLTLVDFTIAGSGATDTGLEFGAFLGFDEGTGRQPDDFEVFISGVFGTITMGALDPATDGLGIADVGLDGIGIDDIAEQFKNATAGADVNYSYSAAGLTFLASAQFGDAQSLGASIQYSTGAVSVGLGYVTADAGATLGPNGTALGQNSSYIVTAGFSQGPIGINGMYTDWDGGDDGDGGQGYGVDVSFTTGATTVTAAYAHSEGDPANAAEDGIGDAYGIGVSVPLGGGLTLAGGIGIVETDATNNGGEDSRTVADLGVSMSF
ncbi:MAG: porin [Paracoccaceae bacterium]|nr:porin [Paracoccaceae bacterium]